MLTFGEKIATKVFKMGDFVLFLKGKRFVRSEEKPEYVFYF